MLNESDRPSGSDTLPPPETNPLSNPLLRDNLRRWAEVYFGNPPERREPAVQELLRNLETEKDPNQRGTGTGPGNASASSVDEGDSRLVQCKVCGHNNARLQRFCGMCGSEALPPDPAPHTELERVPQGIWDLDKTHEGLESENLEPENLESENEAGQWHSESDSGAYEQSVPTSNELSLFQDVPRRDPDYDDPDWQYESSSPSQPFRFYIGIVLAAMLAGLGYMAWRGTEGTLPHQVSSPPPAVVPEATAPSPRQPAAAPEPAAPSANNSGNNSAEAPAARNTAAAKTPATDDSAPKRPAKVTATREHAKAARAEESSGKGAEELSIAERYLSGAQGERRDTAEASKWLWRSVAKHNEQASVRLADLYLRGDGVSKNCDQARMLLDSAARKGIPAAGERLRNLQAFGCQ